MLEYRGGDENEKEHTREYGPARFRESPLGEKPGEPEYYQNEEGAPAPAHRIDPEEENDAAHRINHDISVFSTFEHRREYKQEQYRDHEIKHLVLSRAKNQG